MSEDQAAATQLARDVLRQADENWMPDTVWQTDSKIRAARLVLGIPAQGRYTHAHLWAKDEDTQLRPDSWETLRQEQQARTGWTAGGGWKLSPDEVDEALQMSGIGTGIQPEQPPAAPVIVGPGMRHIIETVNDWLDGQVADTYKEQPLAQDWARVAKLAEELGELREASHDEPLTVADHERIGAIEEAIGRAVSALIGATGQNPRKGVTGSMDDVLKELGDVVCTGLFAIQHVTGDIELTSSVIEAALIKALNRAAGA